MGIRILLADDHDIFLEGLRALLEKQTDMEVIEEVKDGLKAIKVALEKAPDVVVMDISMPGLNGIEATRRITRQQPDVKVLCLTMHADRRFVLAALEAGASGYLLKDCALEELVRAIHTVVGKQTFLSPSIAGIVVEALKGGQTGAKHSAFSLLTDREREVLQLITEGHTTKEIADRLCVSVKTVGSHRDHIMEKLNIHNIAGLTKYAIREGLTSPDF